VRGENNDQAEGGGSVAHAEFPPSWQIDHTTAIRRVRIESCLGPARNRVVNQTQIERESRESRAPLRHRIEGFSSLPLRTTREQRVRAHRRPARNTRRFPKRTSPGNRRCQG
jgi:hypothetical protein